MKFFSREAIIIALSGISVLVLDQLLKYIIRQSGGFFLCNENLAWGIVVHKVIFWLLWLGGVGVIAYFLSEKKENPGFSWDKLWLTLIIFGAFSNFIDRMLFGCVVDFIKIGSFPLFNLADVAISSGVALWVVKSFKTW